MFTCVSDFSKENLKSFILNEKFLKTFLLQSFKVYETRDHETNFMMHCSQKKIKKFPWIFQQTIYLFVFFLFLFKEEKLNEICWFELFAHRQKEYYKFCYLTFYDSILLKNILHEVSKLLFFPIYYFKVLFFE